MSNMSYCRFRNTLRDLSDCRNEMDVTCSCPDWDKISAEERLARTRLIKLCRTIAENYGDSVS